MFHRSTILYSILLFATLLLANLFLFQHSEEDIAQYYDLIKKDLPPPSLSTSKQERFHSHKQILSSDPQRKQTSIKANQSELIWERSNTSSNLLEYFHDFKWLSQEDFHPSPPFQTLGMVESEEATLHYNSRLLFADTIAFARYKLPGYQFYSVVTENPFIMGDATSAQLNFNDSLRFKAKEVKIKGNNKSEKW
jgi:hypothetical protein